MRERLEKIEAKIEKVKSELMEIRTMRPGLVSRQYKDRKAQKGPYYQMSFTYQMKSRTEYVPVDAVADLRQQTAEYNRFKKLIDAWVRLAIEHSRLTIKLKNERSPKMPRLQRPTTSLQQVILRVTLCEIEPPIWRTLKLTTDMTLDQLHYAIQGAFGWENSHLHAFAINGNQRYSSNGISLSEGGEKDSRKITLAELIEKNITEIMYEYDFGDSWLHQVTVEEVKPLESPVTIPECIDGARHCPPEDCGGAGGFENFLEAMMDRKHPDHKDLKEWYGGKFDPEKFSKKQANQEIRSLIKYSGMGFHHP